MFLKRFFLLTFLLIISACTHLQQLDKMPPPVNPFSAELARQYKAYSASENEQEDWYTSEYFAKKGILAASGADVPPEMPMDWKIPEDKHMEAMNLYRRLMEAINSPARFEMPEDAANAQVLYDCWLEQSEENHQINDIKSCHDSLLEKLAMLENFSAPPPLAPLAPGSPPVFNENTVNMNEKVYFGFDKDKPKMNDKNKNAFEKIVDGIKKLTDYEVEVDGHADRAGPKKYNQTLSEKRAKSVKDSLVEKGVKDEKITTKGYGEEKNALPTKDGVAEQLNRRVEINVQGR